MLRPYVRMCGYVTFVTRFKFTCKFRCKFMSAFILQQITFKPSGLESWNFVWHLPTSRPFNVWYHCPRVMPLGGAKGPGRGHPCTVDTFLVFTDFLYYVSRRQGWRHIVLPQLSVCLSVHSSVHPSCSCVHSITWKTLQDIFMKLYRNINHHQTMCIPQNT